MMMVIPTRRNIVTSDFYKGYVNTGDLDYKDVFLIPQYSEVTSRSQVNTSVRIGDMKIDVPVISANMDTVTGGDMAHAMSEGGAIGAIHRFMDVNQNVREFEIARGKSNPCFVSIGVNEESKDRAVALYDAGARNFVIDIAHGHSRMMRDMTTWLRGKYSDVYIMAGNVATGQAVMDLVSWGANAVKVGIGPGCFSKDTLVKTSEGLKPIDQINIGEEVWTHKGRLRKVTNTFVHRNKEQFTEINGIKSTPNHEYYVLHKSKVDIANDDNIHLLAEWIEAEKLTKDYFLLEI